MMATPHMMTGAVIGKTLRRPWLAWPVAFASHFLLDITPHLDSHNLYGLDHGGPTVPEAAIGIADFVLGAAFVAWLVWRQPNRRVILGAALFAIIIDVIENVPPLGPWFKSWPGTSWLSEFHHAFQLNVEPHQYALDVATQVAVIAIALWLLLPRTSRSRSTKTD